jgi:predicted DNA-binding transcriptional regulator AlpA
MAGCPVSLERMSADRLAGIAEVAQILGVEKHTAVRYSQRADFPPPLDRIAAGPVWNWSAIEEWKKKHPELPRGRGRPPKQPGAESE